MDSYKQYFSKSLAAAPDRLHFAAHSHHLWPDASHEGQVQAWEDAARLADRKWEKIFEEVYPATRGHIARILSLPDPDTIALAPNTHEFVLRILSCFEKTPVRVLATDSEFHSFSRQSRRLEEAGTMHVTRVPVEPFATFDERFLAAAAESSFDLVYVSQVFYDSGFVFSRFAEVAGVVPRECFVVIDGYHGFMALPTDLSSVADRAFYISGGYKYAMSGEGVCFLHCPPGYGARPRNTGWWAGFGALESAGGGGEVAYAADGTRFQGSTMDPTPKYRFNAVMAMLEGAGITVATIRERVLALQQQFLEGLSVARLPKSALVPEGERPRGNFLTFRLQDAGEIHDALLGAGIVTDFRRDRLRFGFGVYQDPGDVAALHGRLQDAFC